MLYDFEQNVQVYSPQIEDVRHDTQRKFGCKGDRECVKRERGNLQWFDHDRLHYIFAKGPGAVVTPRTIEGGSASASHRRYALAPRISIAEQEPRRTSPNEIYASY